MMRFRVPASGAATASLLWRALGVLWMADALVKLSLPFGDRPGAQWYEQIMTAEGGPPGFHRILAWETQAFADHPLLWWLPAAAVDGRRRVELAHGRPHQPARLRRRRRVPGRGVRRLPR